MKEDDSSVKTTTIAFYTSIQRHLGTPTRSYSHYGRHMPEISLSPAQEVILEVKKVSKEFPGVKALNNVSFRVVEGEIHCFVGEKGFLF